MPLQAMLGKFSNGDAFRKMQPPENNVVIVDLPAAADHNDHRDGINPMHDPDRQRVKNLLHFEKLLVRRVPVRHIASLRRPCTGTHIAESLDSINRRVEQFRVSVCSGPVHSRVAIVKLHKIPVFRHANIRIYAAWAGLTWVQFWESDRWFGKIMPAF
jgi:hypothetical protein